MKFKLSEIKFPEWKREIRSDTDSKSSFRDKIKPKITLNIKRKRNSDIKPKRKQGIKPPKIKWKKGYALLPVAAILLVVGIVYSAPSIITVSNTVGSRELPIYCVETVEKKVALSFDAAWGNEDTQTLLDILAKHDVKATFFMTGQWVEKYSDDVKAFAAAGHDIGNHSETHPHMSQLSKKEMKEELMKTHEKVKALTGIEMNLFRPPYGDYNNDLITTAKASGYYTIQWDVDSLDWKDYGIDSIISTVVNNKQLGNGSIILMHNGAKYTPEALEAVIVGLKDKGYEIVRISDILIKDKYHLNEEGRQIAGK